MGYRGVPIFPSNKLFLTPKAGKTDTPASGYEMLPRVPGDSTTQIALLRVGEEKQGVVGLVAAKDPGSERFPFISVDPMGISDDSVASYLLSMFVAAATLALALVLAIAAPLVTELLSSWSKFRDESELALLMLLGGLVYGGLILAMFGRRWLSLMRGSAKSAPAATLDQLEGVSPPAPGENSRRFQRIS